MPRWPREAARDLARPAAPDDLLDAVAAAWTARRVVEGIAERLPAEPAMDRRGLRMEIVFQELRDRAPIAGYDRRLT